MKKVNLTYQIKELQLNAIMEELEEEVVEKLSTGDLGQLKAELSSLIGHTNNGIHANVVAKEFIDLRKSGAMHLICSEIYK